MSTNTWQTCMSTCDTKGWCSTVFNHLQIFTNPVWINLNSPASQQPRGDKEEFSFSVKTLTSSFLSIQGQNYRAATWHYYSRFLGVFGWQYPPHSLSEEEISGCYTKTMTTTGDCVEAKPGCHFPALCSLTSHRLWACSISTITDFVCWLKLKYSREIFLFFNGEYADGMMADERHFDNLRIIYIGWFILWNTFFFLFFFLAVTGVISIRIVPEL